MLKSPALTNERKIAFAVDFGKQAGVADDDIRKAQHRAQE